MLQAIAWFYLDPRTVMRQVRERGVEEPIFLYKPNADIAAAAQYPANLSARVVMIGVGAGWKGVAANSTPSTLCVSHCLQLLYGQPIKTLQLVATHLLAVVALPPQPSLCSFFAVLGKATP